MKSLRFFVGLAVLAVIAQASSLNNEEHREWELYKLNHGKNYESDAVEADRRSIYMDNKRRVKDHNEKYHRGEVSFTVSLNHLSDMTTREVAQKYNGYKQRQLFGSNFMSRLLNRTTYFASGVQVPLTVDWREHNLVTPVKNQEQCGGCWAFSATGSIEGQHAKKTGNLVSLSEQNLIDCATNYPNEGCNGGLMDAAFQYVISNGGIDTEASYPFTTVTVSASESCSFQSSNVGATISSYYDVDSGDEDALKEAVGTVGPVSVAIYSASWQFQHYNGGVFNCPSCCSDELDHGVLAVGYDTDSSSGTDYWIVKNSWGSSWGENGYVRMARNMSNQCGIATEASYPIIDDALLPTASSTTNYINATTTTTTTTTTTNYINATTTTTTNYIINAAPHYTTSEVYSVAMISIIFSLFY